MAAPIRSHACHISSNLFTYIQARVFNPRILTCRTYARGFYRKPVQALTEEQAAALGKSRGKPSQVKTLEVETRRQWQKHTAVPISEEETESNMHYVKLREGDKRFG